MGWVIRATEGCGLGHFLGGRLCDARGVTRDEVRNPLFARVYERVSRHAEERGQAGHRQEALAGLRGGVIEVGAGNGLNFPHYPPEVTEVVAVEPEPYLRRRAEEQAAQAPAPVRVVDGLADRLPAGDGELDAGVASLVLCTVPRPAAALAELRRVIRPGGELRFYEHVISPRPGPARAQRALDGLRLWPLLAGGCHCARDTLAEIEAAGFAIESCRRFAFRPSLLEAPVTPKVLGRARRES
jgi:SAM-dependent methyltransferase